MSIGLRFRVESALCVVLGVAALKKRKRDFVLASSLSTSTSSTSNFADFNPGSD
jgi:hypothetical protein